MARHLLTDSTRPRAVSQLVVHPAADLGYASFVLDGLARVLGPDAIAYSTDGFPKPLSPGRFIAFYRADRPGARAFIALHDHADLNEMALTWARVVGMVNVATADAKEHSKILPIGPAFGVRLRSRRATARHVVAAARFAGGRDAGAVVRGAWVHQRRRVQSDVYRPTVSDPDYVFFTAWPWVKHPDVNPPRIEFIDAVRRSRDLHFEGGFAPRRRGMPNYFAGYTAPKRYPMREYLEKISRSALVFNNPAVHGCLGWKLGEFLALGKAIVSTPLGDRALPEPLVHGEHLHIVDATSSAYDEAIDCIRHDLEYRLHLEANARRWYERNLAPESVATRLLERLAAHP